MRALIALLIGTLAFPSTLYARSPMSAGQTPDPSWNPWMARGQTDPFYCKNHAGSATELDRCVRIQHGERLPAEYPPIQPGPSAPSSSSYQEYRAREYQNCMSNPQVYHGRCSK